MLKYLPMEKAQDARHFIESLQYWQGGNPENLANLILSTCQNYVPSLKVRTGNCRPQALVCACLSSLWISTPWSPTPFPAGCAHSSALKGEDRNFLFLATARAHA